MVVAMWLLSRLLCNQ